MENQSDEICSKKAKTIKSIGSNLVRGGLLAIPYAGAAIEKAIFGPLDERANEQARRELQDALGALRAETRFIQSDIKEQLGLLAEYVRSGNSSLAEKIEHIEPVHIENFFVQNIKPTIVNVFLKVGPEEVRSLSNIAGILPGEISAEETSETIGEILLNNAVRQGNLCDFIGRLADSHPSLLEEVSEAPSISTVKELKTKLAEASSSLLNWPTTLANEIWLHRKELDLLEERFKASRGSANLILGKPGTGKSAILALLCRHLIEKGVPVLAIKADMLPRYTKTFDDLKTYLHLPFPLIRCLSIVSRSEPAVLIIDQMDAVSEYVDRKSERLNILLDLIQIVSKIDGIHVVSSCRWFEYQNDIRLTTTEAEIINLNPPSWEDVKRVLKEFGFPEEHYSDEARSLLSVPLHLKILLDLKSRDPKAGIPSSLQGLLEGIWQQRILSGEKESGKMGFIDMLCKRMSEDEELWVPRALADDYFHILEELQQANIVQLDPSGLKIGFVHQTYFDFGRARAFARGQESLSEHVIQRQNGLFIRPVLLSTLEYLRGSSIATYEKEVISLWNNEELRSHLKNLLIDYLGSVEKPNDTEVSCLAPLLEDESQQQKVLLALAGSPGWFSAINRKYLPILMTQKPKLPHYIIPVLSRAFYFNRDEVVKMVRGYWLPDNNYDEDVLLLFSYLTDWDELSVEMICEVAKRHDSQWIPHIANLVSGSKPSLAPKIVKADFGRRMKEALKKEAATVQIAPPADADDEEKAIYELQRRKGKEIENLLRYDKGWHDLSQIAARAPKAFIESLWPWFTAVIEIIAYDPQPFVATYQEDHSLGTQIERNGGVPDQPVLALHDAVVTLSEKEPDAFLKFFYENLDSPYIAVHRLLCAGLLGLCESYPDVVLNYLTSDSRRLAIGDFSDCHKATRRLIEGVAEYLDEEGRNTLELSIINWNRYCGDDPEWTPKDRFKRKKWQRQHRLRLLRSFPDNFISDEGRRLRDTEERALPGTLNWDSRFEGGGWVGSPMSSQQMAKAKDEHILRLFEELPDSAEWDHPKRSWDFVGGSIQASREFGKLAEQEPQRVANIVTKFKPKDQERPVAMALAGLAKSEFPSSELFKVIEILVEKGHGGFEFRRELASTLSEMARKESGLPDTMIKLMETWLEEDPHPSLKDISDREQEEELGQSILWGYDFSFSVPGGRDAYLRALAKGYLLRSSPDYESFYEVIKSRMNLEKHPMIWKMSLRSMSLLYNWDKEKAELCFDHVISNFKDVRESKLGVLEIAKTLRFVPRQKTVEKWLTMFRESRSLFGKQAFGELVLLRALQNPTDNWALNQIMTSLANKESFGIHRGLAFAAVNNCEAPSHQQICTDVLLELSSSDDELVHEAISQLFQRGKEIVLSRNIKKIILAILPRDQLLLKCADNLIEGVADQTPGDPEFVGRICLRILEAGKTEMRGIGSRLALTAEHLTKISITLHRMPPPHRATGLEIFERMIDRNIPQARQALDILDRKPVSPYPSKPIRKSRRLS